MNLNNSLQLDFEKEHKFKTIQIQIRKVQEVFYK